MPLLSYVRDAETYAVKFAIVSTSEGAEYVWPDGVEPTVPDDVDRLERLAQSIGVTLDSETAWHQAASSGLGTGYYVDSPSPFDSDETAVAEALRVLEEQGADTPVQPEFVKRSGRAFYQVAQDYPDFDGDTEIGGDEGVSPEAMTNFVLMALGPIDPDGPNGWLFRAQDGNPEPGDENAVIDWSEGTR